MSEDNVLVAEPQDKEITIAPDDEISPELAEKDEAQAAGQEEKKVEAKAEDDKIPETPKRVDKEPEITPDIQKKMEKLEKRLGYLQRKNDKLERQLQRRAKPSDGDLKAPNPDDFDSHDDYQEAKTQYQIDQGIIKYEQKVSQEMSGDDMQEYIDEILTAGRERYSDYSDIAESHTVPITMPMLQIMRDNEMENPEGIAYYLGKNLKECQAISRMSPVQAARALTKIEERVSAELRSRPTAAKSVKKISNAPPPVKPTGSAAVVTKDPSRMSQQEYESWRRQGGGA